MVVCGVLQHLDHRLDQPRVCGSEQPSGFGCLFVSHSPDEQDQALLQERFRQRPGSQARRCKLCKQSLDGAAQWIVFTEMDGNGLAHSIKEPKRAAIRRFDRAACRHDIRRITRRVIWRGYGQEAVGQCDDIVHPADLLQVHAAGLFDRMVDAGRKDDEVVGGESDRRPLLWPQNPGALQHVMDQGRGHAVEDERPAAANLANRESVHADIEAGQKTVEQAHRRSPR